MSKAKREASIMSTDATPASSPVKPPNGGARTCHVPPPALLALRLLLAVSLLCVGVLHFVVPALFAQIVPPPLPAMLAVLASGVAEVALGIGLCFERSKRWAGLGAIALFVAVFPANIYMATSNVQITGLPTWAQQPSEAARWGRLPVQLLLIAWAWLVAVRQGAVSDPTRSAPQP